jgi:dTDP-4-amino-4,6-dideoxygalactose transaminase
MKVPFLDLKAQYESIKDGITDAMQQVVDSCAFAGGRFVEQFEKEFAEFCQCDHAVGVGSGTEALWLVLVALGIGTGDDVVTVPNTFLATAEAISFCGATPVFIDIDEKTYNIDPRKLREFIEEKCHYNESTKQLINQSTKRPVRAIIPVHLFGQMADMDPIMAIAKSRGLAVIEDACQAHGAQYKGRMAGSLGDAGCFSFYPGKNLGAYGEAGAIVTNDAALDRTVRMLRDHGQSQKYLHSRIGWNARMDGLQGAILSVKLKHLSDWNAQRRRNAHRYTALLGGSHGITVPREAPDCKHVYHIYAIRTQARDALIKALAEKDIFCGIHYPVPIHLQEAYRSLGIRNGGFPIAESCASELVSLPMYPELSEKQIQCVVDEIRRIKENPYPGFAALS